MTSPKEQGTVSMTNRQKRNTETQTADPPRLALRPKEAAKALGIGVRLLWSLTNQNQIPHARLGKAVLYPVAGLEAWLADQANGKLTARPAGPDRR